MKNCKSRKFKVISNMIGYIGVSVCLICAVVYLILHQLADPQRIGAFELGALILLAMIAVEVILVAFVFRIIAIAHARKERAAEINVAAVEEAVNEVALESVTFREETVGKPESPKQAQTGVLLKNGKLTPEGKEKIVATVKKNAPVIAAVAATAAVCTVVGVAVHRRKKAKLRNSILKHLR